MTEEQQIEIWRAQFEEWAEVKCYYLDLDPDGGYYKTSTRLAWEIWLTAMRSMPVIDIPSYDLHHYAPVRNIIAKMDAAGYKYKIKL